MYVRSSVNTYVVKSQEQQEQPEQQDQHFINFKDLEIYPRSINTNFDEVSKMTKNVPAKEPVHCTLGWIDERSKLEDLWLDKWQ